MKFTQVPIVTAGDMSGNINSIGIDMEQIISGSIQAYWTGAPVGSLKLQWSDQPVPVATGYNTNTNPAQFVTVWSDYTGSATAVNGAGDFGWNLFPTGYKWIRLVYTSTSGTGTLTANLVGKS